MQSKEERIQKVARFNDSCLTAGLQKVAPYIFELNGPFKKTLTLCTLVHGNEVGGLEIFLRIIEELRNNTITPKSRIRLMLANVEAYFEDQRYLEHDMNRSFGLPEQKGPEETRAKVLAGFIENSDVLIDIHQTIGPSTTPFFIFETDKRSIDLARYLHPLLPIVTNSKQRPFKGKTSTGYIISKGGMGVTIETGQKGIDESQISLGVEIVRKAIETNFEEELSAPLKSRAYEFSQIIHNPDGSLELVREYNNFDPIKEGELLAKNAHSDIRAETDGVILFPKYGAYAKASTELALILKEVKNE